MNAASWTTRTRKIPLARALKLRPNLRITSPRNELQQFSQTSTSRQASAVSYKPPLNSNALTNKTMRWPWSSSQESPSTTTTIPKDDPPPEPHHQSTPPLRPPGRKPIHWDESLNSIDWHHFTQPSVIIPTVLLTLTTLALHRAYKLFWRRIPTANHITPSFLLSKRKRSLFGHVTSVGDGDNFRLFHTPGGKWAGWGWLPFKKIPTKREDLTSKSTIHIRIAGIDAPELAHFGRPAQPYGQEALTFLTSYILGRKVRAKIYRRDQYERVVGTVWVRKFGGLMRKDVGLEMLKRGLATVYEAKFGAEFGGFEKVYREAERRAKERRVGMWALQDSARGSRGILGKVFGGGGVGGKTAEGLETPREYKTRMAQLEAAGGGGGGGQASLGGSLKTLIDKSEKGKGTKETSKKAASK